MHARPPPSRVRQWAIVLALTALYVAAARLGLALALPPEKKATAVWPPSGIALAAVLLFDRRVWPGIWLGAYLANLWDYFHAPDGVSFSGHAGVAFAIAAGSAAQALLGASLVRRWGNGTEFLDRAEGVFRFLGIALLMCLVSSTVGVASLCLGGFVDRAAVPSTWWTWWLGDTTGVLVLTPLLLAWSRLPLSPGGTKRLPEALLLSGLLLGTSGIAFWDQGSLGAPLAYLTVPVVVWAAFRFGPRGTTAALLLLATVAVWGTAYGRGPFTRGSLTESLWLLQTFVCVLAVTALAVAAVLTEKRYALEQLRLAGDLLRAVADGTTDAVFVKDRAGRYLFFNEAAARFVGRPVEEVLGRDDTALFEPDSAGR